METIQQATVEQLETTITSDEDPTGDVVQFVFVQDDDTPTVAAAVAGSWKTDWAGGRAVAVTPTLGGTGSGATVELEAGEWKAFVRVVHSPEQPLKPCGTVIVKGADA